VLSATPIDLAALVTVNQPMVRVRYAYSDNSVPALEELIHQKLADIL